MVRVACRCRCLGYVGCMGLWTTRGHSAPSGAASGLPTLPPAALPAKPAKFRRGLSLPRTVVCDCGARRGASGRGGEDGGGLGAHQVCARPGRLGYEGSGSSRSTSGPRSSRSARPGQGPRGAGPAAAPAPTRGHLPSRHLVPAPLPAPRHASAPGPHLPGPDKGFHSSKPNTAPPRPRRAEPAAAAWLRETLSFSLSLFWPKAASRPLGPERPRVGRRLSGKGQICL